MDINAGLQNFYLISAVMMLLLAIFVYPTLRDRNKKKK